MTLGYQWNVLEEQLLWDIVKSLRALPDIRLQGADLYNSRLPRLTLSYFRLSLHTFPSRWKPRRYPFAT